MCKDCRRAHYAANKDHERAIRKKWRDANPEKVREGNRMWREKNKEKAAAYQRKWQRDNSDRVIARSSRRRALMVDATIEPLPRNYELGLYEAQCGKCYYCGASLEKAGHHLEHMFPLSRGVDHVLANLCLACPTCNLRKNTKTAEEFFAILEKEKAAQLVS